MSKIRLKDIDVSKSLKKDEYKEEIDKLKLDILNFQLGLKDDGKKVMIMFEGWDASGKGGAIKALTRFWDPRSVKVYPISVPTEEEKIRNYLWRFLIHLPATGIIVIFDRTWYGRVLVERIEGFAKKKEWKRAYDEINDIEKILVNNGTMIFKFFMHISQEEQLKRFKERETNPLKEYKISKEDYENRSKADEYTEAYEDMLNKTSTKYAPWNIIESDDKEYARLKIIKTILNASKN
ncbi:UDP-galactose-lipid carrier transferase [soil metagenome]